MATDWEGRHFTFGCKVFYKPNKSSEHKASHEPNLRPGSFAGYELAPGFKWNEMYLVYDLDEFVG